MAAAEEPRASFLPKIKCSDCGCEMELSTLVDHQCTGAPALVDDLLAFSPALIPPPLRIGPKSTPEPPFSSSSATSSKPRPPAIDAQAANRPFFKDTVNSTPSSNRSSDSRSDSNTLASSNLLTVSNLTANTTPNSEDGLSSGLKSPLMFLMPLMSPRNESPTDPTYVPVSPITDNTNILKRMDTIAPGPFSLASPSLKRGMSKPLPEAPAPLSKAPVHERKASVKLSGRLNEESSSKPDLAKLSKKLPSVPGDHDQAERSPSVRRGTDASIDEMGFESRKPASKPSIKFGNGEGRPRPVQKPLPRNQSPPHLEQRSKTFPENEPQPMVMHSRKEMATRFDLPMGLPRRPSEPTQALRSVPSVRSKQAPTLPPVPSGYSRVQNTISTRSLKALPQSPKPEMTSMRGLRRGGNDIIRTKESSSPHDMEEYLQPEFEERRGLNRPVKAKTWDSSSERPPRPRRHQHEEYPEQRRHQHEEYPQQRRHQHEEYPEQTSPRKVKLSAICRECRVPIEGERPVFSSDGKLSGKFHKKCFKCAHCREPFYSSAALNKPSRKEQPSTFYIFEDTPYCAHDYHVRNNSLCPACGLGIEGDCFEIDFDTDRPKRFHISGCFVCAVRGCEEGFESGYYEGGSGSKRYYCAKHAPSSNSTRRYTRMMPLL